MPRHSTTILAALLTTLFSVFVSAPNGRAADTWKKHVVFEGASCLTAIAADFTGDGKIDIVSNAQNKTRLFVAPDWKEIVLGDSKDDRFIHSEVFDVDGDGDADPILARYNPGLIVWFERPAKPLTEPWKRRVIHNGVHGIHGLIRGDVDRDGRFDLLATSAQPKGDWPESLVWLATPKNPHDGKRWTVHAFANRDAPGLSHYLGFGDVNGDGRPDAASAAKGGPSAPPGSGDWFAWWEAPKDPKTAWTKHTIATRELGATNIHPVDVNGDGKMDFIASRGHGRGVVWFEATVRGTAPGTATSWTRHTIHETLHGPHCLTVADIDGDGDVDAATCAKDDKITAWFENDGKGKFTTHIVGKDQAAYDIRAVDLNGDGALDLLVAGQNSRNLVWYESPLRKKPR